jgi:hypothetical protein
LCCSFLFQAPFTGQRDAAGLCTEIEDGPTTRRPISRSQQSARPVPQQTAQALVAACVHFFSLTACLFASASVRVPSPPSDIPPHAGRPTGGGRRRRRGSDQDRTETATSPRPRLCIVRLRAQALRLRLQPLVRRRMPRLVPPRPSVAPSTAHTTDCSKPPAIASLVAL